MNFYKKIKIVTGTSSKPELFEERVNELIQEIESDERVEDYNLTVLFEFF